MISYLVDVVLLAALALTSLRVAAMHRELRRLRGYQTQYVQVFGETSRAADSIGGSAPDRRGGREALRRLESAIGRAGELSRRLEGMARAAEPRSSSPRSDEIGLYARDSVASGAPLATDPASCRPRSGMKS